MSKINQNVLFSVSDRTGLLDLAKAFSDFGYGLIATGKTCQYLSENNLEAKDVSGVTGFPEILDGRVKTLHPHIHGGILARRDLAGHMDELKKLDINSIDVVVVNLYPFIDSVKDTDINLEDAIEQIDIGGVALMRAAAKNYQHVVVLSDPGNYEVVLDRLSQQPSGSSIVDVISLEERQKFAIEAFEMVSYYDSAISSYLSKNIYPVGDQYAVGLKKLTDLRYGENPHQSAIVGANIFSSGGVARSEQVHGLGMSYTNYLDADAAFTSISEFSDQGVAIIKHANPCGLALDSNQSEAYRKAHEGDPVSAYGGIVAFNTKVTEETVLAMKGHYYDVILAPDYSKEALEILKKRKKARILKVPPFSTTDQINLDIRNISGGYILQNVDTKQTSVDSWTVVTDKKPTKGQLKDLEFAWKCAKNVRSNAIVLASDSQMLGMGAGQPNRVTSLDLAIRKAGEDVVGSAMASDAMIPFPDTVELAATNRVGSIIQPGGSIRDSEVIEIANSFGLIMVFTGTRHFKH